MTTKLEQEFFKVFGVEPHWQYKVHQFCHFYYCDKKTIIKNAYLFQERKTCKVKEVKRVYPEITDRILLEIVCILNKFTGYTSLLNDSIDDIREEILRDALFCHEQLKLHKADLTKQIQQLFKEEE